MKSVENRLLFVVEIRRCLKSPKRKFRRFVPVETNAVAVGRGRSVGQVDAVLFLLVAKLFQLENLRFCRREIQSAAIFYLSTGIGQIVLFFIVDHHGENRRFEFKRQIVLTSSERSEMAKLANSKRIDAWRRGKECSSTGICNDDGGTLRILRRFSTDV